MAEGAPISPEALGFLRLSPHIGAVFAQGVDVLSVPRREGFPVVPEYDVTKKEERVRWALSNVGVYSLRYQSPNGWKSGFIDHWLSDLDIACRAVSISAESPSFREREDSRELLQSMMAVASSARAMEFSAGSIVDYIEYVSEGKGNKVQDIWSEFLLHGDDQNEHEIDGRSYSVSRKLDRLVGLMNSDTNSALYLVRYYYDAMTADMGINLDPTRVNLDQENPIDIERAASSKVVNYLRTKPPRGVSRDRWIARTSLYDYVEDFLVDFKKTENEVFFQQFSKEERRAAARLAADVVLVHHYTTWEHTLVRKVEESKLTAVEQSLPSGTIDEIKEILLDKEGKLVFLKPSKNWGGDPFRFVIQPSFLPDKIKKMYRFADEVIKMIDESFYPIDVTVTEPKRDTSGHIISESIGTMKMKEEIKKGLLKPSATTNLKSFDRFGGALSAFYEESSRAAGTPDWGKNTFEKYLPQMVELLDQIYGGMKTDWIQVENGRKIRYEFKTLGKHLVGMMIIRAIHTKAVASVLERERPGFFNGLSMALGEPGERPFAAVMDFLYGPKRQGDGFFARIAGARTGIVFKGVFHEDTDKRWQETYQILYSADRQAQGAEFWLNVRFGVEIAKALGDFMGIGTEKKRKKK